MNDHTHALIAPLPRSDNASWSVDSILKSIKGFSSYQINKLRRTTGEAVWQQESYDRLVRNHEEYEELLRYIEDNPIKANYVKRLAEYRWYYLSPRH